MQGKVPSQWLYGAVEMEKDGKQVVWEQERQSLLNDLKLVWMVKPDAIFLPNLNIGCHVLLLLLSSFHILNIPQNSMPRANIEPIELLEAQNLQ